VHSEVVPIVEGKLYALVNGYALDGRAGSHPISARGYTTMNCYLLLEQTRALLVSTGYSVHQQSLLAQLEEFVGERKLSLALPRIEFMAMCNGLPIANRFDVDVSYQRLPVPPTEFLNFRPGFTTNERDALGKLKLGTIKTTTPAPVDDAGTRRLEFLVPELRLLPSNWAYDDGTGTLFTGDAFSWVWHDTPEGPWLSDGEDPTTPERIEYFLLENRYWWLAGAQTDRIRAWLKSMFRDYEINAIAPDHGAVLVGDAVTRHAEMLDEVLERLGSVASIGLEAGTWRINR
jgi:hypothetical protein